MRDYSNMPSLSLHEHGNVYRAKAQILHAEPLILLLPEEISLHADLDGCGCRIDAQSAIPHDCDGAKALMRLAEHTGLTDLKILAEAAAEVSAGVDIDADGHRIIIHD